jgi:hypothetical protein
MKPVTNIGATSPPAGAALVLAADAELRATDKLIMSSAAHKLFKRAWVDFLRGWNQFFDDIGQGRREISATDARLTIGMRNEGRSWRGDFEKQRKAGFPKPLEEMGTWEAGACDLDEVGALIYTPGVIKAELEAVNTAAGQLDVDIKAAKVRDEFKQAWQGFFTEWKAFYKSNSGLWSRLWGGLYEKANEYRRRVEQWRQSFEKEGGHSSSPSLVVPPAPGSGSWKWALIGAGGLMVAGALVSKSVMR